MSGIPAALACCAYVWAARRRCCRVLRLEPSDPSICGPYLKRLAVKEIDVLDEQFGVGVLLAPRRGVSPTAGILKDSEAAVDVGIRVVVLEDST